MAIAIYQDLQGRQYWAEPSSPQTLRNLSKGAWVLVDDTPETPPPLGVDLFDREMAERFDDLDSESSQRLRAAFGRAQRSLRPIATQTHIPTRNGPPNNISDGVSTGITTQMVHTAQTAFSGLRLVFANYYNSGGVDADGPNNITVKALVRLADGSMIPVFFGGRRSVVIEPGSTVASDPVGISRAKDETFITRTYVSVSAGEKYPLGSTTNATLGEGVVAGDLANVNSGAIGASATKGYAPWALLGTPVHATSSPRLLVIGDSRAAGYGDTFGTADAHGWVRRAFDGKLSTLNVSVSGSTASSSDTFGELGRRLTLADACGPFDAAIVVYGINDLTGGSTAAQVQTRLTTLYGILAARGLDVYGATIAPVTTSTDNWATTANQTLAPSNAVRIAVNDWLRTAPAPLAGVFDFADAVESARNSGLWKANGSAGGYTSDGTHESAGGYTAEAALIDPAVFGAVLAA